MAITTYNDLAAAVKIWCARSDSAFSNQIGNVFVPAAELRMWNGSGEEGDQLQCDALMAPEIEIEGTVTFTDSVAPLPDQVSTVRTLTRPNDMIGFDYYSPRRFDILAANLVNRSGGDVRAFTVRARNIYVTPAFSGPMNIVYYQQQPGLSTDNQTNIILTKYPLLYFAGVMHEAFSFMQQVDLAAAWFAKYKASVEGVNGSVRGVRYGGMPLRVQPRNAIP